MKPLLPPPSLGTPIKSKMLSGKALHLKIGFYRFYRSKNSGEKMFAAFGGGGNVRIKNTINPAWTARINCYRNVKHYRFVILG